MRQRLARIPPKFWLLLILLALGVVLALFFDRGGVRIPGPVPEDPAGEPDYFLEGVNLTRFNEQGEAYQRLQSPRLVHTPVDDVTRAKTPRLRIYDEDERVWLARGESGRLAPNGTQVTLSGQAELEAPEENWLLETEVLHYLPGSGHAYSQGEATLRQPPQHIRGERFDAWINEGRARLTGKVRGFHPVKESSS
ncbi:LPS export ABC transporter periplasmic protein LptC [Pistricoccus aurantiacus]|uniref:LPS export ABC transporter periplasmic protein LptC n=1 Tax=Pistricoccus aurantiacus TaxID=1883414 RepID=UPI0036325491